MAKIIQFPTRTQLQKKDLVESLKMEIEFCEQNLKEAMEHLDEINEEVVFLTKEYHLLLKELTDLTKEKE
jgi:chromosome segregation ATPase